MCPKGKTAMGLVDDVKRLLEAAPEVQALLGLAPFEDFAGLAGALLAGACANPAIGQMVTQVYAANPNLVVTSLYDIEETARRNFEPGGAAAAILFSRGVQAVLAHRVAHALWGEGKRDVALALKATCGRAYDTDIHPAARIGAGFWLDHGLGFVAGETCIIEEDVSIWHNVTLGSTLTENSPHRHPHVGRGVVIGAGATLLGPIKIGEGANIAAGAMVLTDVEAGSLMTGPKAQLRGVAKVRFTRPGATA